MVKILLTHGHVDHAARPGTLAAELGSRSKARMPPTASGSPAAGRRPLFRVRDPGVRTDRWLDQGDTVTVGEECSTCIIARGTRPVTWCFFIAATRFAFVGDVLFPGSIGRTDFPMGNHQDLLDAITAAPVAARRRRDFRARPWADQHVRARAAEQPVRSAMRRCSRRPPDRVPCAARQKYAICAPPSPRMAEHAAAALCAVMVLGLGRPPTRSTSRFQGTGAAMPVRKKNLALLAGACVVHTRRAEGLSLQRCTNCGELKRPHNLCNACGHYNGREIVLVGL